MPLSCLRQWVQAHQHHCIHSSHQQCPDFCSPSVWWYRNTITIWGYCGEFLFLRLRLCQPNSMFCHALGINAGSFYIWHCVPNILLWSILCKTVGLPSSTGESERTARRQLHSPTLRCFRGHLCEVAAGRGPLKQSRWAESNWTLPLRSVGVAPSLGRFWLVFAALKLRYVLRRHIILSDSDGNQAVLDCFTVSPGLGGSAK